MRATVTAHKDYTIAKIDDRVYGAFLEHLGADVVPRLVGEGPREALDVHAVGAFIDDRLAGFCFGGRFRGALIGFLRTNRSYLTLLVLRKPWLLFNPLFRERALYAVRYINRGKPAREQWHFP